MKRRWLVAAFFLIVLTAMATSMFSLKRKEPPLTPITSLGGAFQLQNQDNQPVANTIFAGKPALYFFGFTHCPDICPTTLYELTEHKKALGAAGEKLQLVFISVDPARDTPGVLKNYLKAFPGVTGLTGTQDQVDRVVKAFHVFAKKTPEAEGHYNVDHTASVFAADAEGRIVMLIGYGEAPDMVHAKLRRLLD